MAHASQSLSSDSIKNYVIVDYLNDWWVGFVVEKDNAKEMARINFLHPKGPAKSFQYPSKPDVLDVPFCDILSEADMSTATGPNYKLKKASQDEASKILRSRI